jgi:hypothetical protein
MKYVNLNFLELAEPLQACNGTALLLRYNEDVPTIYYNFYCYRRCNMEEIQSDGKIKGEMKYCTIGPCKQDPKKITILGIVLCGLEIRFLLYRKAIWH